jgi:hypothetical protein
MTITDVGVLPEDPLPNLAGPGFHRLDGPPGPDAGAAPAFPTVREINLPTGAALTDPVLEKAAQDAFLSGGKTGDLYRTAGGDLYTLEIINGYSTLNLVGAVVGPEGPKGADSVVPQHGLGEHKIPAPIEHIPGNYQELAQGPSLLTYPNVYP